MGKCLKCGSCCKWLTFTIKGLKHNRIFKDYYVKHGCTIRGDHLLVPTRCKNLADDNTCKIYSRRPLLCKTFKGQATSNSANYFVPDCCGFRD